VSDSFDREWPEFLPPEELAYWCNRGEIDAAQFALVKAALEYRQPVSINQALKMKAVPAALKDAYRGAKRKALEIARGMPRFRNTLEGYREWKKYAAERFGVKEGVL
jgi:hypothetical protein